MNRCGRTVYNAGDSWTEGTKLHDVVNRGSTDVHFLVTYIAAKDVDKRTDQPAPRCAARTRSDVRHRELMAGDSTSLPGHGLWIVCRAAAFKCDRKSGAFRKHNHDVVVRPVSSVDARIQVWDPGFHRSALLGDHSIRPLDEGDED